MKDIFLHSPAKLNLYLKVSGKRKDGYHNLITLFERINLCDSIRLKSNRKGRIRILCDNSSIPKGPKNLMYKAAKLLKEEVALANGVDIRITKRIPVAAGLGGGSSNAAAVLLGLNKLWKLSLPKSKLLFYAQKIGSDVPFFVHNCNWAIGRGRGDEIRPLFMRKKMWHILVVPGTKVYSGQVFKAFKLQLTKQKDNVRILTRALRKKDLSKVGFLLFNDLESVIIKLYPHLNKIKSIFKNLNIKGAIFSGSGPAAFGLVGSRKEAQRAKNVLRKYYKRVFIVRTF